MPLLMALQADDADDDDGDDDGTPVDEMKL